MKSVLFLLNKFFIRDVAYHELTMWSGGEDVPRSYSSKQCKDDLNKLCHIIRSPRVAQGVQHDFATELESALKKQVTALIFGEVEYKRNILMYILFFSRSTKTKLILMTQAQQSK